MAGFPKTRLRRLRQNSKLRSLVRETDLSVKDLIYPLFISEEVTKPEEISSMPGIFQLPLTLLIGEARRLESLGVEAVLLFGIPAKKDAEGSQAYFKDGIIQKAVRL
jgi:porphobilinogen synthase